MIGSYSHLLWSPSPVHHVIMRARIPADRGVLLLTTVLPELLFPVQFVVVWTELFSPSASSS
jgi:hypothetical protein